MLSPVYYSTNIDFYPKDKNIGLSRKMLLQIEELSRSHGYSMHLRNNEGTYYTWVTGRVSSNIEIKHMINDIRRICKGIEIVFEIEKRYPKMQFLKINLEEIDSLREPITYTFFHGFNLDENYYYSSNHWELFVNGECKSHKIPEHLRNLPMNTRNTYIYNTKLNHKTGEEEIEASEDGLDCEDWIKENKTWLDDISTDHKIQAEIYEAFRKEDFRLQADNDFVGFNEYCPQI